MSYDAPEVFRKDDIPPHLGITQLQASVLVWRRTGIDEWVSETYGVFNFHKMITLCTVLVEHPSALSYADALVAAYERQTSTDSHA